jgi:solute:Na+ symporter, SSS family
MSVIDWIVLLGTLFFIVAYGTWKTRGSKNIQSYLLGDKEANWWTIGLSVMATQASAITFLSTPGQAFTEGMGFVQFYFGLPLAMIIISVFFIPLFYRLKVYTAYEFLESRFDVKTRVLTAGLFLLQRGLAAGITIYAPAIILSNIIGWQLDFTILFIGILVIIYTVSGGTKAVSQTHKQQMAVIFAGMVLAFIFLVYYITRDVSFPEALAISGNAGKMNVIDLNFDLSNKYNIWSGIIGGLFLQLSYFGTDQSQVQRYLSGANVKQSRLGLMFNGMIKIPMQFFILFVGVLVFVFYEFHQPPVHFNELNIEKVRQSEYAGQLEDLENEQTRIFDQKQATYKQYKASGIADNQQEAKRLLKEVNTLHDREKEVDNRVRALIQKADPSLDLDDADYIFISWVMKYLPIGLIGLLLAVIFSAAMSSTSAELNALASTTTVDIYKRNIHQKGSDEHYLKASKWFTVTFGVIAIIFAEVAGLFENLIELVNIIGSLFYGTILGIFVVAFFVKWVKNGWAVFLAALAAEMLVIILYNLDLVKYLWLNLFGCAMVVILAIILELLLKNGNNRPEVLDKIE